MNLTKIILVLLFSIITLSTSSQNFTNDFQSWNRIRYNYIQTKYSLLTDYEYRRNITNPSHQNQIRFYIQSRNELKLGAGIIYRPEASEFRPYQTFEYDIHQVQIEERIYPDTINLRIRYQLLKEHILNRKQSISFGVEPMLEGILFKKLKPSSTRFYFIFSQKISNPIRLNFGYICEMSNNSASHIIRLTIVYKRDKQSDIPTYN